ncbi:DNA repair protein complementing XP-A cells homolog [Zophobas morio]|uniref:DNA repair protein complementing XP-A cells homolog n=1 Tax=Zophobas morio TaxID=2755281 RepID=UPI003083843B
MEYESPEHTSIVEDLITSKRRTDLYKLLSENVRNLDTSSDSKTGSNITENCPRPRKKITDTKAGFFYEEDILLLTKNTKFSSKPKKVKSEEPLSKVNYNITGGFICQNCQGSFGSSFLFNSFEVPVCNDCRKIDKEQENYYSFITKTQAKEEYLLTENDLQSLRFIIKRNPQGAIFASMKLYLAFQVEEISFQRWNGESGLDEEIARRRDERIKRKKIKAKKELLELRRKTVPKVLMKQKEAHVHEFGEEVYDSAKDQFLKTCKICKFTHFYEKM